MSTNDTLIILLGVIGLPILLLMFIIMPKDKNCNQCKSELSQYRQKTYHRKLNGVEKEVCKRCYGKN